MKKLIGLIVCFVLTGFIVSSPFASQQKSNSFSKKARLFLYEKIVDQDGDRVRGGAWGKMRYTPEGETFDFKFKGRRLEANENYTLIYHPDPHPGDGLICLGEGTANRRGKIRIKGSVDTGDMPSADDDNFPDGARIWLVLSDDVTCDGATSMTAWNPSYYLFEHKFISFEDTGGQIDYSWLDTQFPTGCREQTNTDPAVQGVYICNVDCLETEIPGVPYCLEDRGLQFALCSPIIDPNMPRSNQCGIRCQIVPAGFQPTTQRLPVCI